MPGVSPPPYLRHKHLNTHRVQFTAQLFFIMKEFSFFTNVYDVVRLIPPGRVTNYGAIAKYLGSGLSSRMVGWAMNACHDKPDIPAHRVVNRIGMLTGRHHFAAPELMQQLLEKEGVEIKNDQVVNFKSKYWDPNIELVLK
jgi:methylated-DNA-protein-cysteine methyltransferase-like protein